MIDLSKIDLGKDEAEQDERLKEYFLKTESYRRALSGEKNIIIGRKGSGKSAIFKLIGEELQGNEIVIKITPDQYSWSALKDYQEKGILPELAHTNSWKFTLCSAILYNLNERNLLSPKSKLKAYFGFLNDAFQIDKQNWFYSIVDKVRNLGIKTEWVSFEEIKKNDTPLKIINEIKQALLEEWQAGIKVRILIDRLDDSWDGSKEATQIIIGLLKAAFDFNSSLKNKVVVTTFIRSDIYDTLFFHDQDKLRQYEEQILWNSDELKQVVCERVKVSLNLSENSDNNELWDKLFSSKKYRSKANAEKYIIDRTFKRPRDIISFVRMSLENAVKLKHVTIEVIDTRTAEEEKYSKSKYNDLIIEYQNQFLDIRNLLDSFSGGLHKITKEDILLKITNFLSLSKSEQQPTQVLRMLFTIGFVGIKRRGKAGVQERGGIKFYYYYDDTSINPLNFDEFYIHPSLRYHLYITETREKR